MIRLLTILLFACFFSSTLVAQDPVFSQFYAAPIQLSPAFAGNTLEPRVTLNYRNQWPVFADEFAYVTYAASYEQFLEPMNSAVGLMVMTDNAGGGIWKTNKFSATYGYRLQVTRDFFVKFGVEAGVTQSALDWNKLTFPDQLHPINGREDPLGNPYLTEEIRPLNTSKTYFDISTGLLAYSNGFYVGLSAKHLNTPDETILGIDDNVNGGLPVRFSVHGGLQIPLSTGNNKKWGSFISPNVMLIKQGDFGQVNAGAYLGFGMLFGGVWYRHAWGNPDAAIALIGFQQGILKIGYSYDYTVSRLAAGSPGGSHEISITFNFDNSEAAKRRKRASRYNDCFRMFR